MSNWREPITDRTLQDVKNVDVGSLEYQKGALNADDLNRIEDNYKYLMAKLRSDAIFIPHRLRNFTETVLEHVQTGTEKSEHTVVEYLESTGEQCIDTGIVANQDTRILIDFEVSSGHSGEGHICSARTGTGTPLLTLFYNSGPYSTRYGTSGVVSISGISGAGRHLFDRNKNVLTVDETYTVTSNYVEFTVGSTLPLFCRNDNNGSYNTFISGKLYSCKIWDNDVLIRDYIPVIDADGVACLYDQLNYVYYRNAGTGIFIDGPEVPIEVDPVYEQVEITTTYTDWQENNLPWLSEINRIRANYNALVRLFLVGLGLPVLAESNYLDWQEVNDWERIAEVGKTMFENMEKEYRYCGIEESGGDRLL